MRRARRQALAANGLWADNRIQFPRLLAEINSVGLTPKQYRDLSESMDLTTEEIDELFDRAIQEWEAIKG